MHEPRGIDAADLAVMELPPGVGDLNPDDDLPIDADGFLDDGEPDLLALLAEQDRKRAARVVDLFAERVRRHPAIRIPELAIVVRADMELEHIPLTRPAALVQLAADALSGTGAFAPQPAQLSDLIASIAEYTAAVPKVIPWIWHGCAYGGGVTLVTAPPKCGKSTLLAGLQRSRETGEPYCGWPVASGPALLVTEEGGIAVVHKTDGLRALDVLDRRTAIEHGLNFEQVLDVIGRWCDAHAAGLVIIDTLAIWAGIEDENDASAMTAALAQVAALAQRTGAAVVVVHHARKGGGAHGEAIRGSSAALATTDISLELAYADERYPNERLLSIQGRVVLHERFRLAFDALTQTYSQVDTSERARTEIDEDLDRVPFDGEGLTRDDLRNLWGKDPRRLIERYTRAGRLRAETVQDGRTRVLRYWQLPALSLLRGDE